MTPIITRLFLSKYACNGHILDDKLLLIVLLQKNKLSHENDKELNLFTKQFF